MVVANKGVGCSVVAGIGVGCNVVALSGHSLLMAPAAMVVFCGKPFRLPVYDY